MSNAIAKKKAKGAKAVRSRKSSEPSTVTVQYVASRMRGIKDGAAAAKRKGVFELVCNLNDLILKNASKEESFIKDVKLILKFTKCNAEHARMETNVLQLQLRLKKHLACTRIRHMKEKRSDKSVVAVVLGDKWHPPQYVVKAEKILLLCIQEKLVSCKDLCSICYTLYEPVSVVQNTHRPRLLAKMACDLFTDTKLFQSVVFVDETCEDTVKKLEFMKCVAEADKKGTMMKYMLTKLWKLANEWQAMPVKILSDTEHLKCVLELSLVRLKTFMEVCNFYCHKHPFMTESCAVAMEKEHNILKCVIQNLQMYMYCTHQIKIGSETLDPDTIFVDDHHKQVQGRLDFIQFFLQVSQMKLPFDLSLKVWERLVDNPVFPPDQDTGLGWLTKLFSEQRLHLRSVKMIINKIVMCNPQTLTYCGFCWKVILNSDAHIAHMAIVYLKNVYTKRTRERHRVPDDFFDRCFQIVGEVHKGLPIPGKKDIKVLKQAVSRLTCCIQLLSEYVKEMDKHQPDQRSADGVSYRDMMMHHKDYELLKKVQTFAKECDEPELEECVGLLLPRDKVDSLETPQKENDPSNGPKSNSAVRGLSFLDETGGAECVADQSRETSEEKRATEKKPKKKRGGQSHGQRNDTARGLFTGNSADQPPETGGAECAAEKKTSSLLVSWKTEGSPPQTLQDLRPNIPLEGTSALVHWGDWDCGTDELLERVKPIVRETCTSEFTLTVSPAAFSSNEKLKKSGNAKKLELAKEAFYSLCKNTVVIEMGASCEDYIVMYTGKEFNTLKGIISKRHHHLEEHPMMKDIKALSDMVLGVTCDCGDFESVISKENVIYVALLYLNDTPAYYVGKAITIEDRWRKSHCQAINHIMRRFERAPGAFEQVIDGQHLCDLVIAGAVLKQVATRCGPGVALFVIDVCPKGNLKCCNPKHQLQVDKKGQQVECKTRKIIDHHEQHYMNAFAELFPDSDTEPKMKCLNAINSCLCHYCSDGNVRGCSTEVALSVFLHDLQLA